MAKRPKVNFSEKGDTGMFVDAAGQTKAVVDGAVVGKVIICKKGHPIKDLLGDNGCGIHTIAGRTVTNCVAEDNG